MGKSEKFTVDADGLAEETLWTAHPSVWLHSNRWGLAILLALLGVGLFYLWRMVILLAPLPISLFYGAWLYGSAHCTEYKLTTERLIWSRGVFARHRDQVELYRVRDVSMTQPFYLRVMGLGNVMVLSSDISTPNDHLLAVEQPQEVEELVRAAVESIRSRRGIRAIDFETR